MTPMGDTIGVPQLHRLWSRAGANTAGRPPPFDPVEAAADKIAIYGLGLGLHETLQFLHARRPAFDIFLDWILGLNGGEDTHTLNNNELPSHSHALVSSTNTASTATPGPTVHLATASAGNLYAPAANAAPYQTMAACIQAAGNSVPHNNIMPTLVGNYCIAWAGIYPSAG